MALNSAASAVARVVESTVTMAHWGTAASAQVPGSALNLHAPAVCLGGVCVFFFPVRLGE